MVYVYRICSSGGKNVFIILKLVFGEVSNLIMVKSYISRGLARIGVWSDPVGGVTGYERRARMIDPRTLRPSCCACRMDCCPRLGPVVDATKWCQRILSLSPCSFNTRVVLANRPPPLEYNNFTEIKNRI
jgi:hypothetical protein